MSEYGLKVLWPEDGKPLANEANGVDIVFVHGLRGGRLTTWKKKEWTILWPKDLLHQDIPNIRVMTWGYDANVLNFFEPVGSTSILGHAMQFLQDLSAKRRDPVPKDRPIIFIAHSLGGLVVKEALYQSHSEGIQTVVHKPRHAAIRKATAGVIFAGTPHRGSDAAKWALVATHLAKYVLKNPNDGIIRALSRGSETLEKLQSDFSRILSELPVYTFSEDLDWPGNGKIVDKGSSIIGFPHEVQGIIPANHKMMVKFQSRDEIGYERIKDAVMDLIEDWRAKQKLLVAQVEVAEVRQKRMLKYATYSGMVAAENVHQGDVNAGGDVVMTMGGQNK